MTQARIVPPFEAQVSSRRAPWAGTGVVGGTVLAERVREGGEAEAECDPVQFPWLQIAINESFCS